MRRQQKRTYRRCILHHQLGNDAETVLCVHHNHPILYSILSFPTMLHLLCCAPNFFRNVIRSYAISISTTLIELIAHICITFNYYVLIIISEFSLLSKVLIIFFPFFRHIWGYLRVVFTSMNRLDLTEISSKENAELLAKELNINLIHPS